MSEAQIVLLLTSTWQTIYMVFLASLFAILIGLPVGVMLVLTASDGLLANRLVYKITAFIVNVTRSVPFIILLVAITPLTQLLTGTTIGTIAAIVPLAIAAAPFVARIIENALQEVPRSLINAGLVMGATPWQLVYKIMLPEALPSIIDGLTVVVITLIGYSAMAGAIGGGGLGEVGINYGYERFNDVMMLATVVVLLLIVQCVQTLGDTLSKKLRHR